MSENKLYKRFDGARRIEHLLLVLSFSLLGLTGLIQKFAMAGISQWLIDLLGGIESVRIIHRIASFVFVAESIYHFALMGYKLYVQRVKATMLPGLKDVQDGLQALAYNFGLVKHKPRMGRYNFAEKVEYWAMLWGLFVMALTGFMLWNPIATAQILPGQFVPAAKVAHGWEAVLAVAAILVWHFYNVHLKSFNKSMINGHMKHEEMEEEHALELEEIEAGVVHVPPEPAVKRKRAMIFTPIAVILSAVLIAALIYVVTFEETAITTLPPASTVEVFVPQTATPVPTQEVIPTSEPAATGEPGAPAAALTWDGEIGALFDARCKMCHGAAGGLALTSYADLLKGGGKGAVLLPGDPLGSPVVQVQLEGKHPGQFTADELAKVQEWIAAGAPEN